MKNEHFYSKPVLNLFLFFGNSQINILIDLNYSPNIYFNISVLNIILKMLWLIL